MRYFLLIVLVLLLQTLSFSQSVFIYDNGCKPSEPMSEACQRRKQAIEEEQKRRDKLNESRNEAIPDLPPVQQNKVKLSPELSNLIKVSKEEKSAYENSLGKGKFEIVKIWNNICGGKVFDTSNPNCINKAEYPNVSHYSFYFKDHKQYFANIFAANNYIYSIGNRPSLMIDLGDISLDSVNLETKEAKLIAEKIDSEVFEKLTKSKDGTIEVNTLKASYLTKIEPNKTYLLRSTFEDTLRSAGFTKVDTIFAFRVLKFENDFVTLAWKKVYLKDGK